MVETIDNSAYLWSCRCPDCGNYISRGHDEKVIFCSNCGVQLHQRAFTDDEIKEATEDRKADDYED